MRLLIILFSILLVSPGDGLTAQTYYAKDGFALFILKYNGSANIYGRLSRSAEYESIVTGKLYRTFPTGPKLVAGDDRLPNGIHEGWIDENGTITLYVTTPLGYEAYVVTGPSLERRCIPLDAEFFKGVTRSAAAMRKFGYRTIPVVILPGTLEPEVADKLRRARDVREGQTLDDVQAECQRWRPVEEYIIRTGRLPGLRFEGDDILIVPHAPVPPAIADDTR